MPGEAAKPSSSPARPAASDAPRRAPSRGAAPMSACWRAASRDSRRRRARWRTRAAPRSCCRPISPTPMPSSAPPPRSRSAVRPDRHLGQLRDGDDLFAVRRSDPGRIPPRHRGHLSRLRLRHDGGAAADAAARPRHDRAGRLGAGLSRDPAAIGLLRRQIRDPRLYRQHPLRIAARQEPGPHHDGADAGAQHAAIRLGAQQDRASGRSRCRRSFSRNWRPRRSCSRRMPGGGRFMSAGRRQRRSWPTRSCRGCSTTISRAPATAGS